MMTLELVHGVDRLNVKVSVTHGTRENAED